MPHSLERGRSDSSHTFADLAVIAANLHGHYGAHGATSQAGRTGAAGPPRRITSWQIPPQGRPHAGRHRALAAVLGLDQLTSPEVGPARYTAWRSAHSRTPQFEILEA